MTRGLASAKRRGAETQRVVATYLAANGWPYATDAGAGRSGSDILGVPGLAIEVKARADFQPLAWLRQAALGTGLPLCVVRPNGLGPQNVAGWLVAMRLSDAVQLLRAAGYGDPPEEPQAESVSLESPRYGQDVISSRPLKPPLRSADELRPPPLKRP